MSLEVMPAKLERANTMANVLDEYLHTEIMHSTPTYRERVSAVIIEFVRYVGRRPLSPQLMAGYAGWLADTTECGVSTLQSKVNIVRRFMKWCWRMRYTQERWHEFFPTIRLPSAGPPQIITHTEYHRLIEACRYRPFKWAFVCGYHTGMRLGDICNLRWADVDMEKQLIRKPINKTQRTTRAYTFIPFLTGGEVHQMLLEMRENPDDMSEMIDFQEYVSAYLALHRGRLGLPMTRIFREAGVSGKMFRMLRNTFDSRLANSGMNMALAAKITGRSDPRVLLRYIRVDPEVAREGIAKAMELHEQFAEFR